MSFCPGWWSRGWAQHLPGWQHLWRPPFRESNLFVADLSVGVAINYKNTKLAYAFVYRTKEFSDPAGCPGLRDGSSDWTF